MHPRRIEIHLPVVTILKVLLAILAVVCLNALWQLVLLLLLAILLAVTLHPIVMWLEQFKVKRAAARPLVIGLVLVLLGTAVALVVPALLSQIDAVSKNLPDLKVEMLAWFPPGGFMHDALSRLFENPGWDAMGSWITHVISLGGMAVGGVTAFLLVLVLAFYLLIDGQKTLEWLLAFFATHNRMKMRETTTEVSKVIFAYVAGQAITSLLVTIYSFIVLAALKVPAALTLAVVAGFFDVLPILGFFISTVPACLLALSVSSHIAFAVALLFFGYHMVENYLIIPRIYGKRLRLSTLAVLLALLVGGMLAGIPGALAALPVVASYAIIERIWLTPILGDGVAKKHERQKDKEFGPPA